MNLSQILIWEIYALIPKPLPIFRVGISSQINIRLGNLHINPNLFM